MKTALKHKGIKTSERTIYRAMKKCGLLHRIRKPRGITKADTETQERKIKRFYIVTEVVNTPAMISEKSL